MGALLPPGIDWPGIINAGKTGNSLSAHLFLGFMFNPATAPAGAIGLSITGGAGLAWGAAESYATNSWGPIVQAGASAYGGFLIGKSVMAVANVSEAGFNWGAMRYISTETGRFVPTAFGGAAVALSKAADSIGGSIIDIFSPKK